MNDMKLVCMYNNRGIFWRAVAWVMDNNANEKTSGSMKLKSREFTGQQILLMVIYACNAMAGHVPARNIISDLQIAFREERNMIPQELFDIFTHPMPARC